MMARGHVASGVLAGVGTSFMVPDLGFSGLVPWTLAVMGASILPDLDHPGSTVSRMWGPLSTGVSVSGTKVRVPGISTLVSVLSCGHRAGTHSVLGVVLVAVLFAVLALHPIGTGIGTAFGTGLVLSTVGVLVPGKQTYEYWPINLGISVLVGVGVVLAPVPVLGQYLWLAMAVGAATHILGDMLTVSGCPLGWPFSSRRYRFLRLKAGGKLEPYLIGFFLIAAVAVATLGYGAGSTELLDQLAL